MFGKFLSFFLLVATVYGAKPRCPNEGVIKLANPNELTGYYLCLEGARLSFNCGHGKIFDPISQSCELFVRRDVLLSRVNPLCPSTGWTQIPHDTSCSKFFNCNEGVATVMTCPLGLHYNPATEHCDYPEVAKCTLEDTTQAPTSTESATLPAVTTLATDPSTLATNPSTSATDPSTSPTDLPTSVTVPPTSPTVATTSADFTTTPELTTVPIEETTTPTVLTTLPAIVPPQNLDCSLTCVTETAYVPDESICDRYWRCENGEAVWEKCQIGLRFNQQSKACDYAINVKCT